jgi:hypothetical protein
MGAHHKVSVDKEERYEFTAAAKKRILTWMGVGIVMTVIGIAMLALGIGESKHEAAGAGHGAATHASATENHSTANAHSEANGTKTEAHTGAEHADVKADAHGATAHAEAGHATEAHAEKGHAAAEHGGGHHEFHWTTRLWADLWHNAVFFTGIAIIGVFFVAVQYLAYAGWSAGIKRVPEAFGMFLPIGAGIMLVVFGLGHHDLFHWTHEGITDPTAANYDKIIAGKSWYLNLPFYLTRMVAFFGLWMLYYSIIRKNSLAEDLEGGTARWKKLVYFSSGFIVIFAVSSSMAAWDWVMSIDPHWFSTLFGWYTFASWHVSGLACITLTVILLKERGYLKHVNMSTVHDLGKFMFAFSVFWAYLWTSQFLLYYYANIPEEVIYYIERRDGFDGKYTALFFLNVIINFAFPFLFLMTRDSKRQIIFLKIAAIAILAGHWLDFYLMIMPGVTKGNSGFGFLEFGLVLTFVCLFIYVISNTLSKQRLTAINHPMLEESLHHDI